MMPRLNSYPSCFKLILQPTVFFTGPDQIELASSWAPFVRCLMFTLHPVTFPIVMLMEILSSAHGGSGGGSDESTDGFNCGTFYNRGELAALIRVQYEEKRAMRMRRKTMDRSQQDSGLSSINDMDSSILSESGKTMPLSPHDLLNSAHEFTRSTGSIDSHDVALMEGALQFKSKTAADIFLSFHKVFCLPQDMVLDETNIFTIYASGYSRVPVYMDNNRRRVKGILLTRKLMVVKAKAAPPKTNANADGANAASLSPMLSEVSLHTPHCVGPETNLSELINLFQSGKTGNVRAGHMALVCARPWVGNGALERGEALPEDAGLMG